MTAEEYLDTYGASLEEQLRAIATDKCQVDLIEATYYRGIAGIKVTFRWGNESEDALREVKAIVNSFAARLPGEARDNTYAYINNENTGFFAATFYSPVRDLDNVYETVEPVLAPRLAAVKDAATPELYNPGDKEIRVELRADAMAALGGFLPRLFRHRRVGTRPNGKITAFVPRKGTQTS